jgi:hypothetical protein
MSALRSSVLIVEHPKPQQVKFGADFVASFKEAKELVSTHQFHVLVAPARTSELEELNDFLGQVREINNRLQVVLVHESYSAADLKDVINNEVVFKILRTFQDVRFEHTVQEALAQFAYEEQVSQLFRLYNDQNEKLADLSTRLEARVERRHKNLLKSQEKAQQESAFFRCATHGFSQCAES